MTPIFFKIKSGHWSNVIKAFSYSDKDLVLNVTHINSIEFVDRGCWITLLSRELPIITSEEQGHALIEFLNYHQYLWGTP
jgi:hypothetical protein